MGQVPAQATQSLRRAPVNLPDGLSSDHTLALVTFNRSQRCQFDRWIEGLKFKNDSSISWMRILVLSEQGTADGRSDAEKRVIERHTADKQRTRVLPMFMDKTAFARSAGLTNIE